MNNPSEIFQKNILKIGEEIKTIEAKKDGRKKRSIRTDKKSKKTERHDGRKKRSIKKSKKTERHDGRKKRSIKKSKKTERHDGRKKSKSHRRRISNKKFLS